MTDIDYRAFDKEREQIYKGESLSVARSMAHQADGWVEDFIGTVIHGRKPVGTIDLTPTWRYMLPLLLEAYTNGSDKGRAMALEELQRLCDIADRCNAGRIDRDKSKTFLSEN